MLHLAEGHSGLGDKYGVGKGPWKEVCWLEPLEEVALVGVALTEPERGLGAGGACSWGILEAGEGTGSVRQGRRKPRLGCVTGIASVCKGASGEAARHPPGLTTYRTGPEAFPKAPA